MNLVPVDAAITAASFLAKEWSDRTAIGTTPHVVTVKAGDESYQFFVFEAHAADGSSWYIGATRWGHRAYSYRLDLGDLRIDCQKVADQNERLFNKLTDEV